MTTLRQRFRDYRRADGDFPDTPEEFECSRAWKLTGAVMVGATGFVLTAPFGWALLQAAEQLIPTALAAVLGLSLYFVALYTAKYVGGPLADHILGIPREVNA